MNKKIIGKKIIGKKIASIIAIGILIFLFVFSVVQFNKKEDLLQVSSTNTLSNKKIGWGIKRGDNHEQPDVGSENRRIIEQYDGICMGNPELPYVYLTFDNGYEAGYTEKILNVLKENQVTAAFFLTGHYINTEPELVQKMIDEGHTIGNHTVNHKTMPDITNEQIQTEVMDLHKAVYEKFGYEMKYIRPPKGEYSERTIAYTNTLGYKTVMWSFAYDDWDENKQGREEYGKQKILDNIHNGAVILLHGTSKDNSNILDECIKEIKNMGYEFKSLDEFAR